MPDFVAIDFETANADLASICQYGVAAYSSDQATIFQGYVDPECEFDDVNIMVHGIAPEQVQGAPVFARVYPWLRDILCDQIIVCHTSFDRTSLARALQRYSLPQFPCTWLDSAKVARRTWPQYARAGFGLGNLAADFGITFQHHAAGDDARVAGQILLRAIADSRAPLDRWTKRARADGDPCAWADCTADPLGSLKSGWQPKVTREANPDGPLYGEILVFTGELSITRQQAADLAALAGCEVAANVTKHTTLLVVGDQDLRHLAGYDKSGKHRRAEELIAQGRPLRILGESDFMRLVDME